MYCNQSLTTILSEWISIISGSLLIIGSVFGGIKYLFYLSNKKKLRIKYLNHRYNPFNYDEEKGIYYYTEFEKNPKQFYISINLSISNPTSEIIFLNDIKLFLMWRKSYPFFFQSRNNLIIEPNINSKEYNLDFVSHFNYKIKHLEKCKKLYFLYTDNNNKKSYIKIQNALKNFKILNGLEMKREVKPFI